MAVLLLTALAPWGTVAAESCQYLGHDAHGTSFSTCQPSPSGGSLAGEIDAQAGNVRVDVYHTGLTMNREEKGLLDYTYALSEGGLASRNAWELRASYRVVPGHGLLAPPLLVVQCPRSDLAKELEDETTVRFGDSPASEDTFTGVMRLKVIGSEAMGEAERCTATYAGHHRAMIKVTSAPWFCPSWTGCDSNVIASEADTEQLELQVTG